MTINTALRRARATLRNSSDAPNIDAARLLLFTTKQTESSWLVSHGQETLSPEEKKYFLATVEKRATGYPLAYILGSWHFYGREFVVTPDVLIPRPATEQLIEIALAKIENLSKIVGRGLTIADIGTGSGCIAITLALESPFIEHIYATDISEPALEVASKNAEKRGVSKKITFLPGSLLEPLQSISIDLIVSNPPYIPSAELDAMPTIATKSLQFEPRQALDGSSDGQTYINTLKDSGLPAVLEVTGGTIEVTPFSLS